MRHAPISVCGMLRFRCAAYSVFTVRHAPIYAILEHASTHAPTPDTQAGRYNKYFYLPMNLPIVPNSNNATVHGFSIDALLCPRGWAKRYKPPSEIKLIEFQDGNQRIAAPPARQARRQAGNLTRDKRQVGFVQNADQFYRKNLALSTCDSNLRIYY